MCIKINILEKYIHKKTVPFPVNFSAVRNVVSKGSCTNYVTHLKGLRYVLVSRASH